jgi:hypothetical protein
MPLRHYIFEALRDILLERAVSRPALSAGMPFFVGGESIFVFEARKKQNTRTKGGKKNTSAMPRISFINIFFPVFPLTFFFCISFMP